MGSPVSNTPSTATSDDSAPNDNPRKHTISFISIFIITVVCLLTGYRYAINTRANDWFLFQVAKNTSQVLSHIGYSSELESHRRSPNDPAHIRASWTAWARGQEEPTAAEIAAADNSPLSKWELWAYRAEKGRRAEKPINTGPRVSFVLTPDTNTYIREAEAQLDTIRCDETLDPKVQQESLEEIQQHIRTLRTQLQQERKTEPKKRGYSFHFVVVSECGAIEVMSIFLAAVLAFPTLFRKKLLGILLGLPLMYLVNIFRLTCLAIIGALDHGGKWFEFAHYYAWQAIYIIFVVAVWLAWIEFIVRRDTWAQSLFRRFNKARIQSIFLFCIKFLVSVTVLVFLWWEFIPIYGYFLVQTSGVLLKYLFHTPIEAAYVHVDGLFNTNSALVFQIENHHKMLPMALLVTNLPPYIALILATSGLGLWKRVRILLYGITILILIHIAYVVVIQHFQALLQAAPEAPTAIMQFLLTLPFLLWLVFVALNRSASGKKSENTPANTPENP